MARHKEQSRTGSIKVDFTIACVSYNLYKNIKCKYHDPFNDDKEYDDELLGELTKNYYYGLSKFLDKEYFDYQEYEFWGEPFYKVQLTKLFQYKFPFFNLFDIPSLLLPAKIKEYAENGLNRNFEPFIFDTTNEISNNIYIDNDRVGLIFERPSSGAITPEHLLIDF